jgi:hypothetical protein
VPQEIANPAIVRKGSVRIRFRMKTPLAKASG